LQILNALKGEDGHATERQIAIGSREFGCGDFAAILYVDNPEDPKIDRAADPNQ
jgi:hypothetical protein